MGPDEIDILVIIGGLVVGVFGIALAIRAARTKYKRRKLSEIKVIVELPDGRSFQVDPNRLSDDQLSSVLSAITTIKTTHGSEAFKNQQGKILPEVLFYGVPAIIALTLVAVAAYLALIGKELPPAIVNSLTTVIGYFFGVSAQKNTSSESSAATAEQMQAALIKLTEGKDS